MMLLGISSLIFLASFIIGIVIWSFDRYRQTTRQTYVFHPGGAAISIYDEQANPATTQSKTTPHSLPNR